MLSRDQIDRLIPHRDPFSWIDEVVEISETTVVARKFLDPGLPVMKALGVPELRRHLAAELSLEQAIAAAQQATRNYAKRQATWLRHQLPGAVVYEAQYSEDLKQAAIEEIRRFLLTEH